MLLTFFFLLKDWFWGAFLNVCNGFNFQYFFLDFKGIGTHLCTYLKYKMLIPDYTGLLMSWVCLKKGYFFIIFTTQTSL